MFGKFVLFNISKGRPLWFDIDTFARTCTTPFTLCHTRFVQAIGIYPDCFREMGSVVGSQTQGPQHTVCRFINQFQQRTGEPYGNIPCFWSLHRLYRQVNRCRWVLWQSGLRVPIKRAVHLPIGSSGSRRLALVDRRGAPRPHIHISVELRSVYQYWWLKERGGSPHAK